MGEPLAEMGKWRGLEGAYEISIPLFSLATSWFFAYRVMSTASPGRSMTTIEVWTLLGACVAITSWAVSRQLYLARKRRPWTLVIWGVILSLGMTAGVSSRVQSRFESGCGTVEGEVMNLTRIDTNNALDPKPGLAVCRVGGVPDNPYLIGTLFRQGWDGTTSGPLLLFLTLVSICSSLAFREKRLKPTKICFNISNALRFMPSAGSGAGLGDPGPGALDTVACVQPTLWGETCGQLYSKEKEWYDGEWCLRCQQPFRRSTRHYTFKVVTLFTGDVDVLNGLERIDTVSWDRGDPISPDPRLSGVERWVQLGAIELPDVVTISQALALVHEALGGWKTDDPRVEFAVDVAMKRASRISCWFWSGQLSHRLTYARPNGDVILAVGPQRLRDLIEDAGEELWLQLDIGLLPMELRTGFKKTFIEEGRRAELQNSKLDLWIPVGNPTNVGGGQGIWVPRIEGDALRVWLSTDRLQDDAIRGVTIPLPYLRYDPQRRDDEAIDRAPQPGSLDFVRYPLGPGGMEPVLDAAIGASMTEWDWLEWQQIELLRKEALVLEELG